MLHIIFKVLIKLGEVLELLSISEINILIALELFVKLLSILDGAFNAEVLCLYLQNLGLQIVQSFLVFLQLVDDGETHLVKL